jgi:hypothetical protein
MIHTHARAHTLPTFTGAHNETPSVIAERMFVAAQLCASERAHGCGGKEEAAIALLDLSLNVCPDQEGARRHPRLRQEDYRAVDTLLATGAETQEDEARERDDASSSSARERGVTFSSPSGVPRRSSTRTLKASDSATSKDLLSQKELTTEMEPRRRLVIAQMLLATGDLKRWAMTLVRLLTGILYEQETLVLQCFVQLVERASLINMKPITLGGKLLVRWKDEWVEGRLSATKKCARVRRVMGRREDCACGPCAWGVRVGCVVCLCVWLSRAVGASSICLHACLPACIAGSSTLAPTSRTRCT